MSSAASSAANHHPSRLQLVSFVVQARPEPGVMPRVLELFAKRGLVPRRWYSEVGGREAALTIDVQTEALDADTVSYVANCMRQITGVETVLTAPT